MTLKSRLDYTIAPEIQFPFTGYKEVVMGQTSFHLNIVSKISWCSVGTMLAVGDLCVELLLHRQLFPQEFLLLLQDENEMTVCILKCSDT